MKKRHRFMILMPVCALSVHLLKGAETIAVWRSDTSGDFERHTRDRFVVVQDSPPAVRLARSWLAPVSEKGVCIKNNIHLSDSVRLRRMFYIPQNGVAEDAELHIYGGAGLEGAIIEVNGNPLEHLCSGKTARGWRCQDIPGEWLREGPNEMVFSSKGLIILDARGPVKDSYASYDGGKNWHPADGEAIMRLRIRGYPPRGIMTSQIIDTARVITPKRAIGPWPAAGGALIEVDADIPEDTAVEIEWRSGDTPRFDPKTWRSWQNGTKADADIGRYFQWRMTLSSRHASRTPVIRSVCVSFSPISRPESPAWLESLNINRFDRPDLLESSYAFTYETDSPRVRYLRDKYHLETLLDAEQDDLANTTAIRNWTSRRWKNGWNDGYYKYTPPWDAHILLEMAPDNLSLGMCTHYATVYVQSSASLGYLSRHVILHNHCVAETFLEDRGIWIIQDPGAGPDPDGFARSERVEKDGIPLNALELHRIWRNKNVQVQGVPDLDVGEPWDFMESAIERHQRFAIPMRNDHLSNPDPSENEHGWGHYRYDGYLWWADDIDSPPCNVAMYSRLSNRTADFYPSVNLTGMELDAEEENVLNVMLYSTAPNLDAFEINVDNDGWAQAVHPVKWRLNEGSNALKARSVNVFGRRGITSSAIIILEKTQRNGDYE